MDKCDNRGTDISLRFRFIRVLTRVMNVDRKWISTWREAVSRMMTRTTSSSLRRRFSTRRRWTRNTRINCWQAPWVGSLWHFSWRRPRSPGHRSGRIRTRTLISISSCSTWPRWKELTNPGWYRILSTLGIYIGWRGVQVQGGLGWEEGRMGQTNLGAGWLVEGQH
jgi:hypothetical protein